MVSKTRHGGRIAKAFFGALVVAVVLNGSIFWLKRVGILEPQLRRLYYSEYYRESPEGMSQAEQDALSQKVNGFTVQIFAVKGYELLFKVAKDLLVGLFLIYSFGRLFFRQSRLPSKAFWPAYAFLALWIILLIMSLWHGSWVLPWVSLRPFSFLLISLAGAWAVSDEDLHFLAKGLVVLGLIQLLLLPMELARGIHLFHARFFGTHYGDRVVGTLLLPSSLSVFAVFSLAFYYLFSKSRSFFRLYFCVVVVLVYFSASGIGWLLLASFLAFWAYRNVTIANKKWIVTGGAIAVLLLMLVLPHLVGRPDVYQSVAGRVRVFERFWKFHDGIRSVMFGKGLGVGTNLANNIDMYYHSYGQSLDQSISTKAYADSTPMALLQEAGLIGLLAFYFLLAYAAWKDRTATVLYFIIALASLTINVMEFFPLNVLFGILLARSFSLSGEKPSIGDHAPPSCSPVEQ